MSEMLDISYAQGNVSQAAFASMTGIDRVVLRASRSDSALAQDSVYAGNVANARAAGKSIAHYHFNGKAATPTAAADFMAAHITVGANDVIVLDVENEAGVTPAWTPAQAAEFLNRIGTHFPRTERWVYMSQSVTLAADWSTVVPLAKLWVASYTNTMGKIGYWPDYVAWQYTSSGRVPGINSRVDLSRYGSNAGVGTVTVAAPAAPQPVLSAPTFPLPAGSYFGPKSGPAQSVSGYFSHGGDLAVWQRRMAQRGWTIGADGRYGPQTESVARSFQAQKGLAVDGKIGPATWAAAWTSPVT